MPPDTELVPVSRTVGEDQLVDEMVFKFTHTIEMDWMLPGIAPTGRPVEAQREDRYARAARRQRQRASSAWAA